ncbi:MAG TPA: hypothetical protein DCX54_03885 [Flavobacteriales bacterium]|nr:hypothetical protein [Flavobacteriales bacterium]
MPSVVSTFIFSPVFFSSSAALRDMPAMVAPPARRLIFKNFRLSELFLEFSFSSFITELLLEGVSTNYSSNNLYLNTANVIEKKAASYE